MVSKAVKEIDDMPIREQARALAPILMAYPAWGSYGIDALSATDVSAMMRIAGRSIEWHRLSSPAIPSADLADVIRTIDAAPPSWHGRGYPTALSEVRDMASVGRELIETITEATKPGAQLAGWAPADSPAEIVSDLLNDLHEARSSPVLTSLTTLIETLGDFIRSGCASPKLIAAYNAGMAAVSQAEA